MYAASHALIIGINKYKHVGPLIHASNDAEALAKKLINKSGFPSGNVELLLDDKATQRAITQSLLRFADSTKVKPDDRLLVFFAGHGHTELGRRGEAGHLVPVDGDPADLSTLIRWDELRLAGELERIPLMLEHIRRE